MLAAEDMRAGADPEFCNDSIAVVLGGATVEALVALLRRVDLRHCSLADLAAEDDLLEGDIMWAGRSVILQRNGRRHCY